MTEGKIQLAIDDDPALNKQQIVFDSNISIQSIVQSVPVVNFSLK